MFVPLAGKHALTADGFKTVPDPTDTGEQIDKAECIVRVRGRRTRKQVLQITKLTVAQAAPCPLAGQQSLKDGRAPVALTVRYQLVRQRFDIINIQQLAQ